MVPYSGDEQEETIEPSAPKIINEALGVIIIDEHGIIEEMLMKSRTNE